MWSSTLASWHFAFQHHAHCSSTQCTVRPIGSTVTALGLVFITYCPVVRRISLQSPPLAFEPSRSLLLVSGTICHNTSLLRLLFTSLHLGWKLCFLSRTVLNVQCLWSDFVIIRHSNRSSYLLTYLYPTVMRCPSIWRCVRLSRSCNVYCIETTKHILKPLTFW